MKVEKVMPSVVEILRAASLTVKTIFFVNITRIILSEMGKYAILHLNTVMADLISAFIDFYLLMRRVRYGS